MPEPHILRIADGLELAVIESHAAERVGQTHDAPNAMPALNSCAQLRSAEDGPPSDASSPVCSHTAAQITGSEDVQHPPGCGYRTNGVVPQIEEASCGGRPHWVHLYTLSGDYSFGYTGTYRIAYNNSYDICFGNNYGSYTYSDNGNGDGDGYSWVRSITINGWSGNATCSSVVGRIADTDRSSADR